MRCAGATRRVVFGFPLHPSPEGGCSNRVWEADSSCVSMIIWALQRSTLKADMVFVCLFVFPFFFGVSLESWGIPTGSKLSWILIPCFLWPSDWVFWMCNKIDHLLDVKDGSLLFYGNIRITCDIRVDHKTHQTLIFSTFLFHYRAFIQKHFTFCR